MSDETVEAASKWGTCDACEGRHPPTAECADHWRTVALRMTEYYRNARQRREQAEAERDRLKETLLSRHGGEPLHLLDELDEARAERDRYREALEKITQLNVTEDGLFYVSGEGPGRAPHIARRALRGYDDGGM